MVSYLPPAATSLKSSFVSQIKVKLKPVSVSQIAVLNSARFEYTLQMKLNPSILSNEVIL
jgi:hypothetical protein